MRGLREIAAPFVAAAPAGAGLRSLRGRLARADRRLEAGTVAVDVNAGHLAVAVVGPDGNVIGTPATIGLDLAGLPATARDGRLRAAISGLIVTAGQHGARAIVIEDLDFAEARSQGRERHGSLALRAAGGDADSGGQSRASPPPGSATAWSRWPPTPACQSSSLTLLTPPGGGPSTGSPRCGSITRRRPAITRQRW